jgi:hypothetical protein
MLELVELESSDPRLETTKLVLPSVVPTRAEMEIDVIIISPHVTPAPFELGEYCL